MKIVTMNSFIIFMSIMVLINLSNTPPVDSGPATTVACILACCGTACASASTVCLPLGAVTGPAGIMAAAGCFLAAGGACAACTSACLAAVPLPLP